jgi:DNA-binding transcriptional LysR family regulator
MIDKSNRSSLPKTSLEHWSIFAAVVDHGGFSQAAAALNRSQSAVSYSVARLQEAMGLPLLIVEGRKSVLTAFGKTLLNRVRPLLKDLKTLESLGATLKEGWEPELRIVVDAAFPRVRLLDIIAELQKGCPGTQVQLSDVVLSGAEEAIVRGSGDVVVTSKVPPGFLGDWLLDVEFLAVARPEHPLFALGRELTTEDLVPHVQAVVRDSGTAQPRDEGWLGASRRFTVSSMDASLATVLAGLTYAWLPDHLVREPLREGRLQRLPLLLGASRKVALQVVVPDPVLLGPAARMALDAFHRLPRP